MNPINHNRNSLFPVPVGRQCKARTRSGDLCRKWTLKGKSRCRLHGGLSTGPRTAEGLKRSQTARLKHGKYSAAAKAERRRKKQERMKINCVLDNLLRSNGRLRSQSIDVILSVLETRIQELSPKQIFRIQRRLYKDCHKRGGY